jgi:TRAP transporter 4TM/12TM fusion protein
MSVIEMAPEVAADSARVARWTGRFMALALLLLGINQTFNFGRYVGLTVLESQYLYLLLALSIPLAFLIYPAWPSREGGPRWYDWLLSAVAIATLGWFAANAYNIMLGAWEMSPPPVSVVLSVVLWALVIEAARRAGGMILASVVLVFSFYPIFADLMPGPISGFPSPFWATAGYHTMGQESILGIPLRAFATLVFGFVVFGAALEHTGAGRFFINLSFALLGQVRGGPAKVAILSSGLMGSLSGSVVTNVMTTGVMTIPAMRRTGMKGTVAAGVETCASTGGVLMPPVMGAAAFVMANFLQVPYADIAIAATVPAFLYFFGLFIQIDARAAREGLKGLEAAELPSLRETLADGWYHIFAISLLIFMLLVLKRESYAPFYATAVLIGVNQIASRQNRWTKETVGHFFDTLAKLFAQLAATLAAVGMIVGGLALTGLAGTLVNELLTLAGGSPFLLLVMGAVTSLILGIGMTATACYIFLAVMLAPALIKVGFDPMAVHLYIFYWGMLSFITPPVALGAFAAASIARTPPMATAFESMKIGSIIYFIPFFFVFDPALILHGSLQQICVSVVLATLGVYIFAGAIQGWVPGIGKVPGGRFEPICRGLLLGGAVLIALPAEAVDGWSDLGLLALGLALMAPVLAVGLWRRVA